MNLGDQTKTENPRIGNGYEIIRPLARGGFGSVLLGRQIALDREVAIKTAILGRGNDDVLKERFRREALLIAGITHPNVIIYHDFFVDDDGSAMLVMELLKGRTVLEILRDRKTIDIETTCKWIAEASAGLSEAHSRGIIHRDIKPSNLFVVTEPRGLGRVKVIDFGILKVDPAVETAPGDLTADNAFIGTPDYVAPEVVLGLNVTSKADQYALALVTLEMITGIRAFPPREQGGLLQRLSQRPRAIADVHKLDPHLTTAIAEVLRRALSPRAEDRYESIVRFAKALVAAGDSTIEESLAISPLLVESAPDSPGRGFVTEVIASSGNEDATRDLKSVRKGGVSKRWVITAAFIAALSVLAMDLAFTKSSDSGLEPFAVTQVPELDPPTATTQTIEFAPLLARGPDLATSARRDRVLPVLDIGVKGTPQVYYASAGAVNKLKEFKNISSIESISKSRPRPVSEDKNTTLASPKQGRLSVNADPWADVRIDGRFVGRTPLRDIYLDQGEHEIEFSHPKLGHLIKNVDLGPGEKKSIVGRF